jgi:methionyl-tRNA formyltransferase
MDKKLLLIGRGTVAVHCLDILAESGKTPVIVVCDGGDTGTDTWTRSLFRRARELGYDEGRNLFRQSRVNDPAFLATIRKIEPRLDIIFSVQPKAIFRKPFLSLARDYVVNLHFAPLPKLRGVAPVAWAILDGLRETGVTLHLIEDEGIDNGPVLFQRMIPIEESDTTWTLYQKCVAHGAELFRSSLGRILANDVTPVKQIETDATYHPMGELDYSRVEVSPNGDLNWAFSFIRSRIFPPIQLPWFVFEGKKVFIEQVAKRNFDNRESPGKIVFADDVYRISFPQGELIVSPSRQKQPA